MKNTDESSDKGYILDVDFKYLNNLYNSHNDLPFLPERNKIKKCLVCNLYKKKNCAVDIRTLEEALIQ